MSTSAANAPSDNAPAAAKAALPLVLRGTRPSQNADAYDTTVLLFKAPDAKHLQGFVTVAGVKRQVIAHINERHPNKDTGEIKPNFITLTELDTATEKWEEIGHGNAVNRRSDGKPVYFDEVLFNVQGETLRARITMNVDVALQRQLGFENPRVQREAKSKAPPAADSEPAEQRPARSRARSGG